MLGLAAPDVVAFGLPDGDTQSLYVQHRSIGSWAHALADGRVIETAPAQLWSQLEDAWVRWQAAGAPEPREFLVDVDGQEQGLRTAHEQLTYRLPAFV